MSESSPRVTGAMDAKEQRQRERKHILAINGASQFLDVVRVLLEEELYNVTTTNYVPRTFDQIVGLEPSLIVIDLAIHVQAGWDLLERLHHDALTLGIPVIVMSTDQRILDEAQADFARYGGQRFINKPFDIDELVMAVNELIGEA